MKAVILAAGVGSRLRPITDEIPKCLVKVNNKSILQWQVEHYIDSGIQQIIVVAGYLYSKVNDMISDIFPGNKITVLNNTEYSCTNNMYSLYLCKELVEEEFILSNGDVVFDQSIIKDLSKKSDGNYICCQGQSYDDEAMKVIYDKRKNRIVHISKSINAELAYGNSIDLYRFDINGRNQLFSWIKTTIEDQHNRNAWTEVAIDNILENVSFQVFEIGQRAWKEIDTILDLEDANNIFKE